METELQKIIVNSETGPRSVDVLVKVWGRDGIEQCLLLHIEIQAQRDPNFQERMLEYFFKLRDVFRLPVASFAILADDSPSWKPGRLMIETLGTRLEFGYSTLKLLDMDSQELEQSDNPFAMVILAHLAAMRTTHDANARRAEKLRLIRRLYDR